MLMEKECHSQKINSRWIVDLNVIGRTLELIEESIGEYIYDVG